MKTTKLFLLVLCPFCMFLTCNNQKSDRIITTPRNKAVPLVIITSKKEISDDPKVAALLKITQNDSLLVETAIGIELRGALSQSFDKKSYGFECRNQENKGKKVSFFGMSEDEDWVLHGPMNDRSLIRNPLAYSLSNQIGKYAAKSQFVELEINGNYKGLYLLMEKLKRDSLRINIKKLKKEDVSPEKITGGYVLKIDKTTGNDSDDSNYTDENSFVSHYDYKGRPSRKASTYFLYDYPKAKNINLLQRNYIQKYMHDFEQSLLSDNFKDEKMGYRNFIDADSFVDYFILTELFQNHDGYRLSTYLQKDRGKKLQMGPIWDIDIAFGSDNGFCDGMNRHAWVFQYNQYCSGDSWLVPFWWKRLITDTYFKEKLLMRWQQLRKTQLSDNQLYSTVEEFNKKITDGNLVTRNFERWDILNEQIVPNSTRGSHEKEITRMKIWLKTHARWIDENIVKL